MTTLDLATAVSDLDDAYLQVQLLLAQRRAGSEEPRRAALWHTLAVTLAEELSRRGLTGSGRATPEELRQVQEELVRDAEVLRAEYDEAAGRPALAGDPVGRQA